MDFEAVVTDGANPTEVKNRSITEVQDQPEKTDSQGVLMPNVEAGQTGRRARTVGAAAALMSADCPIDQTRRFVIDAAFQVAVVRPNRGECQLTALFWRSAGCLRRWSVADVNHDTHPLPPPRVIEARENLLRLRTRIVCASSAQENTISMSLIDGSGCAS